MWAADYVGPRGERQQLCGQSWAELHRRFIASFTAPCREFMPHMPDESPIGMVDEFNTVDFYGEHWTVMYRILPNGTPITHAA